MTAPNLEVVKEALMVRSTFSDFALPPIIGVENAYSRHLEERQPDAKKYTRSCTDIPRL